jgi:serine/threonine protein kinase/Leucine-rich repeat (LRR) protein
MPVTAVPELFQLIDTNSLLSAEQFAEAQTWPEQEPKTLLARMVNAGWLTKWQAQQVLAGKGPFCFGRYKLLDLIGLGGMGAVYKAVQPSIGRIVALKVMNKQVLKQPKAIARFLREIRTAAAVDDPHIVRAIDADRDGDTYFLVMEYVTGRNLKLWLAQEHSLPVGWSCECIRQAALGLQHAFELGMVHRDIKPSNLLVTQGETDGIPLVKILDLGLSRFVSETRDEGELTRSGQVLGTPDYIAPEQARNTKTADIRADIFSLGCALFELLTGRLPFPGENIMEKLMARASHDAPPVRMYRPEVPAELDAVVARMLARNPQFRYGTPAEVARALAPFSIGTAGAVAAPAMPAHSQADVSTQPSGDPALLSTKASHEPTLSGFPVDLTHPAPKRAPRPVWETAEFWKQPRVRIAAGIVAGIVVLAVIGSLIPRRKGAAASTAGKTEQHHKKHKHETTETIDEPTEPAAVESDPERATALWILQQGGTVMTVAVPAHGASKPKPSKTDVANAQRHESAKTEELPKGPLHIVEAKLPGELNLDHADFERIAELPDLQSLDISGTRFAGVDLAVLQKLDSLTRLDLRGTQTTDEAIRYVRSLPNLQSLQLGATQISGATLDLLRSMKSLSDLGLEGTRVSDGDLKHVAGMRQLTGLNLADTRVRGPGLFHLRRMKGLTSLDLGGLPMQNNAISHLKELTNLRYLRLSGSRVTDGDLAALSGITNLHELLLRSTGVSGAGLKSLTWMAELEILDLEDTVVGDDGCKALSELSTLKSLNVQGSLVSDAGIPLFSALRSLESADLSGTKATLQGVDSLRRALPNCKIEF